MKDANGQDVPSLYGAAMDAAWPPSHLAAGGDVTDALSYALGLLYSPPVMPGESTSYAGASATLRQFTARLGLEQ